MALIEETVDVALDSNEAYKEWMRFESFGHVMRSVERVIKTSEGAHHWVVKVAGRHREFDTKITADEPGRRVGWEAVGQLPHTGTVLFTPLGERNTRLSVSIDWHPGSLVQKAGSAIGSDHREVRNELWRFKDYVEAGGSATHHWAPEHGLGSHDYYGGTMGGGFPPGRTELRDVPVQDPAARKDQPGEHGEMGTAHPRHRSPEAGRRPHGDVPEAARDPEGGATGR
ncbi:cyclase/dehydrase [Arthrobacter crystallopoietes BAB-32]|uniref:Cyclase/dehydrase n=1 Tax=Arthrobacter crystallopoietes BAB-32 TaxID=1246476 RepID=N1UYH0_9MICC|nr:SRPBCC family protein [Arthrobacter crystallopoietes]EMY35436.1 cyclase/dehydrase [Arthrobacter crystallopoietes BAB-32]